MQREAGRGWNDVEMIKENTNGAAESEWGGAFREKSLGKIQWSVHSLCIFFSSRAGSAMFDR